MPSPILYSLCGKMGAGKSTLSQSLAAGEEAALISEDEWLATLYPGQINSFDDYLQYSSLLKPLIHSLVADILRSGISVVMDFPANTPAQRRWFTELADSVGAASQLIYLKASDEVCLQQIAIRRTEQPERAVFDTEAVFTEVTKYFQEPGEEEGLTIRVIEKNS